MKFKPGRLRKIDAIIVVILIVTAGIILLQAGYIKDITEEETPEMRFIKDLEKNTLRLVYISGDHYNWDDFEIQGECDYSKLKGSVRPNDIIYNCHGKIVILYKPTKEIIGSWVFEVDKPPASFFLPNRQVVAPSDEGRHYDIKLLDPLRNIREWWTWTAVFDKNSDLADWTITISFMHLSRGDLGFTLKPDVMVLTLHSPDGKEYGGIINKERGLGLFNKPTLEAGTRGVDLKFEDSWAQGQQPSWDLYIVSGDIDPDHNIIVDVNCFVKSDPIWTHSTGLFDKGDSNIASYIFFGMQMSGTIEIDGKKYNVDGIGHHHHTWSTGILNHVIKGWDFCHMKLENGWNIYYSKYYLYPSERSETKESKINPLANIIITADNGETITELKDINIQTNSEDIFRNIKIPVTIDVQAEPSLSQTFLKTYGIELDVSIEKDNVYERVFNSIPKVGMNVGRTNINGNIIWYEDNIEYNQALKGTGSIWTMRQ